jgi:uncharacterized membrane protein YoaK (UPF0700 family)
MPVTETSAKPSALVPLLLLLSATTGLVDAVSVLGLGKVFTANMTGNVVLLGFSLAGVPGFSWQPYVLAIALFALGATLAGRIGSGQTGQGTRGWLLRVAGIETALLWIAAANALAYDPAHLAPSWRLYCIIGLTAVAMGLRNATVRQLKVPDLTTTVLTLTITGLAADSSAAGGANPNWARRIGAVAAMLAGATVGALLVLDYGLALPLLVAGAAGLLATLLLA